MPPTCEARAGLARRRLLIFVGLGVFSVTNRTVFTALVVCAFAFASSIFLVLELDMPYSGLITISADPLRAVAAGVGRR